MVKPIPVETPEMVESTQFGTFHGDGAVLRAPIADDTINARVDTSVGTATTPDLTTTSDLTPASDEPAAIEVDEAPQFKHVKHEFPTVRRSARLIEKARALGNPGAFTACWWENCHDSPIYI